MTPEPFDFTAELASITSGLDDAVATLDSLTDLVHRIAHGEPDPEPVVVQGALIDALRDLAILYAGDPRNGETDLILVFGELTIAPGQKHAWVADGDTVYDPARGRLTARSAVRTHQPTRALRAGDVLTPAGRLLLGRHGAIPAGISVTYVIEPEAFDQWATFEPVPLPEPEPEPEPTATARQPRESGPPAPVELPDIELAADVCLLCDGRPAVHARYDGRIGELHADLTRVLVMNRLPDVWAERSEHERTVVRNLFKRHGLNTRRLTDLILSDRLAIHEYVRQLVTRRLESVR